MSSPRGCRRSGLSLMSSILNCASFLGNEVEVIQLALKKPKSEFLKKKFYNFEDYTYKNAWEKFSFLIIIIR